MNGYSEWGGWGLGLLGRGMCYNGEGYSVTRICTFYIYVYVHKYNETI